MRFWSISAHYKKPIGTKGEPLFFGQVIGVSIVAYLVLYTEEIIDLSKRFCTKSLHQRHHYISDVFLVRTTNIKNRNIEFDTIIFDINISISKNIDNDTDIDISHMLKKNMTRLSQSQCGNILETKQDT